MSVATTNRPYVLTPPHSYENPNLEVDEDEPEAGPIQKLQAAIIEDINLYANRDEETFHPFLPNFAQLVWNLLLKCKPQTNFDNLTTTSLKFLASIVSKKLHEVRICKNHVQSSCPFHLHSISIPSPFHPLSFLTSPLSPLVAEPFQRPQHPEADCFQHCHSQHCREGVRCRAV